MKILMMLACAPLLAASSVLPTQESKPARKEQKVQEEVVETKATKSDPVVRAIDKFIKKKSVSKKNKNWRQSLPEPPKQEFSAEADYFWHVQTAVGTMKIRYFPDTAPMHVTSGIYLARRGFYDGLNFHRIIPGFMAQGGCPTGSGFGNPGYFMEGEFKGNRRHDKAGILSTANTGNPKSEGSQFFITFGPTPALDGKYTIWGEVVEGEETLTALAKLGSMENNGMLKEGPKIIRTWIEVAPKAKKKGEGGEKKPRGDQGDDK